MRIANVAVNADVVPSKEDVVTAEQMGTTTVDMTGKEIKEIVEFTIEDEAGCTVAPEMGLAEEVCQSHRTSNVLKDALGQNKRVHGLLGLQCVYARFFFGSSFGID